MIRSSILKFLERRGYRVEKLSRIPRAHLSRMEVTDLRDLVDAASGIPGMLTPESGKFLYTLCYMQGVEGDVVEIGSWQGYSTSFLARAVADSKNGTLYAVDHFKGNVGKESRYVVGRQDLSDLRGNFEANMRRLGLWESLRLLDMPDAEAAEQLAGKRVRFLFVDGDHTREGVEKDINLFFPLLIPGAIVVFDDFTGDFPGLVAALDELVARRRFRRIFSYEKTLVMEV